MTTTLAPPVEDQPAAAPAPVEDAPSRHRARSALRITVALVGAVVIYFAFLWSRGVDPGVVISSTWTSAFGSGRAVGETLLRLAPLVLAGLAVAVPARAGLFNIGGEGQLLMGAVGAFAVSRLIGPGATWWLTLWSMALGGILAGAAWAMLPAALKIVTRAHEAITSLLFNYVAVLMLTWLVFEPWKDPASLGQAYTAELAPTQKLPVVLGDRVHVGVLIALLAAPAVWLVLRSTRWGFALKVLGGNPSAAHRAGLAVGRLTLSAMAVGGGLAGLGGMIEVAGVEGRLRPGMMAGFGFIGFLAAWLARHDPLRTAGAALLLAAVAVGGNGLKIAAGVSGAAVNILMALLLLAILGWGRPAGRRA